MTDEDSLRKKLDRLNQNSHYGIMIDTEITDIVRNHIKRLEENEMKATSVQKIENVKEMNLAIEKSGVGEITKVIVGASTNDDIFEFHFSGEGCVVFAKQWFNMVADKAYKADFESERNKRQMMETENSLLREKIKKLEKENKQLKEENFCVKSRINAFKNTNGKLQDEVLELKYKLRDIQLTKKIVEATSNSRLGILEQAKKCVCGQREQDYGTPESNFQLIADLWNDYLKKEQSSIVVDAKDVAMMMALMKIARIRNGGGSGDSFVDLAGYAACGGEIWALQKETN